MLNLSIKELQDRIARKQKWIADNPGKFDGVKSALDEIAEYQHILTYKLNNK